MGYAVTFEGKESYKGSSTLCKYCYKVKTDPGEEFIKGTKVGLDFPKDTDIRDWAHYDVPEYSRATDANGHEIVYVTVSANQTKEVTICFIATCTEAKKKDADVSLEFYSAANGWQPDDNWTGDRKMPQPAVVSLSKDQDVATFLAKYEAIKLSDVLSRAVFREAESHVPELFVSQRALPPAREKKLHLEARRRK
jgi:hypothetical protein